MLKLRGLTSLAAGQFLAVICLTAPAMAHPVTYVSGKGTDTGACDTPAAPCRTFQFAVNQTEAGGEVKALDPADYSPVTINNKSISITGVQGAGIDTNGSAAITITNFTGTVVTVWVDHLTIKDVSGSGTTGIGIGGGASVFPTLNVTHCNVSGYQAGIAAGNANSLIVDTIVTGNGTGISLSRSFTTLDHVVLSGNTTGLASNLANLRVVDTLATANGTGFSVALTTAYFAHSTITDNTVVGINLNGDTTATSFGDNHIKGNVTDVTGGTLTVVGTQ